MIFSISRLGLIDYCIQQKANAQWQSLEYLCPFFIRQPQGLQIAFWVLYFLFCVRHYFWLRKEASSRVVCFQKIKTSSLRIKIKHLILHSTVPVNFKDDMIDITSSYLYLPFFLQPKKQTNKYCFLKWQQAVR